MCCLSDSSPHAIQAGFSVCSAAGLHAAMERAARTEEQDMNRTRALIAGGVLALVVVGGTTGMAIVANDDDRPLTGSTLDRAQ